MSKKKEKVHGRFDEGQCRLWVEMRAVPRREEP
jgi:hypothetical protein